MLAPGQKIVGDLEVALVDGEVDDRQPGGVFGPDVSAVKEVPLDGGKLLDRTARNNFSVSGVISPADAGWSPPMTPPVQLEIATTARINLKPFPMLVTPPPIGAHDSNTPRRMGAMFQG